jgi:putative transposase
MLKRLLEKTMKLRKLSFELLKLKKQGRLPPHIRKVSPPGYWKDRFTGRKEIHIFIRNDRYHLEPVDENGGYLVLEDFGLRIRYAGRIKWEGRQGRLEIVYVNGKWFAYVPIDVRRELPKPIRRAMLSLTTRIGRVGLLTQGL